jgi:serine protease
MRKFLLLCLFVLGVGFAVWNFPGLRTSGEYDSLAIDFRQDIPVSQIESQLGAIKTAFQIAPQPNSEFSLKGDRVYTIKGDKFLLDRLRSLSSLMSATQSIEPNYVYKTTATPNDPFYSKQWHLQNIHTEKAWEQSQGAGITVAVIDTGVTKVKDLEQTTFVNGYDFVNNKVNADDDNGHGTHVAGSIAQSTNNNYGVAGVAYNAKIMPLKVLAASGGGTVSDIAESIRFAADNGADIINMSLGGGGESAVMKDAINYAHNKGVTIIAAAGNENRNSASFPARYPHVIGVAAYDAQGEKAEFSNYGAGVDIAAPGGGHGSKIWQETIDPDTNQPTLMGLQGTSMAAPHVAGVAALVKAAGVTKPDEIAAVLEQSARKIASDPQNFYGAGQLDAAAAVELALKGKFSFGDFFRWLRDNGYLNPVFWIDGGAVALLPKVLMVLGSYLLAFIIRNYIPMTWGMAGGMVAGSSGLFFLRGLYIFDLPQAPFRVMGSSLPELGGAISGSEILNPIFASILIPAILMVVLWSQPKTRSIAIGVSLGVASCLFVSGVIAPNVWMLGDGLIARAFLIVNALLCFGLARFAAKGDYQRA